MDVVNKGRSRQKYIKTYIPDGKFRTSLIM